MNILIAPDKFKGTLSAEQVASIIGMSFQQELLGTAVRLMPLADGGEGTVRALTAAAGGTLRNLAVTDPLGRKITAEAGVSGNLWILEMAAASGMVLLKKEERNPLNTTTFGTGEMIRQALENGAGEIILGIGGSATNDGGIGMAAALGIRFYDVNGNLIPRPCGKDLNQIGSIDLSGRDPRLENCQIRIASDVRNPLLGPDGATAVYSPQKGSTPESRIQLEQGLAHLKDLTGAEDLPGDGAAGGLGFGLRVFCHAESVPGAGLIMQKAGFFDALKTADMVITGEGCTDSQTEAGKLCCEVAKTAKAQGIPCILLSGGIAAPRSELMRFFTAVFAAGIGRSSLSETLSYAREDLESAARSLARFVKGFRS